MEPTGLITDRSDDPAREEAVMSKRVWTAKGFAFLTVLASQLLLLQPTHGQSPVKEVRMRSASTHISFFALYTAFHRGFFKDEGIDLEIIYMPANLASTAVLSGDIDYNGAVTGT